MPVIWGLDSATQLGVWSLHKDWSLSACLFQAEHNFRNSWLRVIETDCCICIAMQAFMRHFCCCCCLSNNTGISLSLVTCS